MEPVSLVFALVPWQPSAAIPGNPDARVLGVRVRGVAFLPAAAEQGPGVPSPAP